MIKESKYVLKDIAAKDASYKYYFHPRQVLKYSETFNSNIEKIKYLEWWLEVFEINSFKDGYVNNTTEAKKPFIEPIQKELEKLGIKSLEVWPYLLKDLAKNIVLQEVETGERREHLIIKAIEKYSFKGSKIRFKRLENEISNYSKSEYEALKKGLKIRIEL